MITALFLIFAAISAMHWIAFLGSLIFYQDDQPMFMLMAMVFQLFAMLLWGRRA